MTQRNSLPLPETVATVVTDFGIHWAGSGPIATLIDRNKIKVGDSLCTLAAAGELIASERDYAIEMDKDHCENQNYLLSICKQQKESLRQALDALEFFWRDVPMNEYAFEKCEAAITKVKCLLDDGTSKKWPETAEQVSNFIGSNFDWREGDDVNPSENDKYCLSAHDLSSAFSQWQDRK